MSKSLKENQLPLIIAMTASIAMVVTASVTYFSMNRTGQAKPATHDAAYSTPAAQADEAKEEEEEEVIGLEFPAEGPVKTLHMDHDQEAIITMYWGKHTWASIEHFRSEVWPNEATILELEEPLPGLYPLKLDTGEIRGYVQVD